MIVRYKAPTIAITTQASSTVLRGSNFVQPITIQILDGNGSPLPGIVVTAAIESGTGGSLSNASATTDANGNATFTNLQISGPVGNSYTLNFTVPGSSTKVVSNTITIICTQPSALAVKNDVQCFNTNTGQIIVTGGNGTSPYAFSIDNGANYYNADGSFNYDNNGNNIHVTGTFTHTATTGTFQGLPVDSYKIRVKDTNGCESKPVQ